MKIFAQERTSLDASMRDQELQPRFFAHLPPSIFLIAVFVAFLQIAPYWRAALQTPPGWVFTGNISNSPDYMQYRVWSRQTQDTGPLVENKFTSESNKPHLLVIFYYIIGKVSGLLKVEPEIVYAYSGSIFAFLFTILLFSTIRYFIKDSYQTWWIFLITLFGGGLGAHLKLIANNNVLQNNFFLRRVLLEGFLASPSVFENYRGNYIVKALFDSHFLLIWLVATASVVSLYFTLERFSFRRLLLTGVLYASMSLLHIYEGITLLVITFAVAAMLRIKKLDHREVYITLAACSAAVGLGLGLFGLLYLKSGLPLPAWRGSNVIFSYLLIAYPVAWAMIVLGIDYYWRTASFQETFLIGWALGCTALTLSGPFYPYPDRGTMTLQIPLYLIAGSIYFSRYKRVTWPAALVVVLLLCVTPYWILKDRWIYTSFDPNASYMFINQGQKELIDFIDQEASKGDILITDMERPAWENDLLWLGPKYPGKFYCGHFFLTVDYDRKCQELVSFYRNSPQEQVNFLQKERIRFVFVDKLDDVERFKAVPGLVLAKATSAGALFEYQLQLGAHTP